MPRTTPTSLTGDPVKDFYLTTLQRCAVTILHLKKQVEESVAAGNHVLATRNLDDMGTMLVRAGALLALIGGDDLWPEVEKIAAFHGGFDMLIRTFMTERGGL